MRQKIFLFKKEKKTNKNKKPVFAKLVASEYVLWGGEFGWSVGWETGLNVMMTDHMSKLTKSCFTLISRLEAALCTLLL